MHALWRSIGAHTSFLLGSVICGTERDPEQKSTSSSDPTRRHELSLRFSECTAVPVQAFSTAVPPHGTVGLPFPHRGRGPATNVGRPKPKMRGCGAPPAARAQPGTCVLLLLVAATTAEGQVATPRCACTYGEAATGPACVRDKQPMCKSCLDGFGLVGTNTSSSCVWQGIYVPPRVTQGNGCECQERWGGSRGACGSGYCCNPNNAIGGAWCMTVDPKCVKGKKNHYYNWDYCAPKVEVDPDTLPIISFRHGGCEGYCTNREVMSRSGMCQPLSDGGGSLAPLRIHYEQIGLGNTLFVEDWSASPPRSVHAVENQADGKGDLVFAPTSTAYQVVVRNANGATMANPIWIEIDAASPAACTIRCRSGMPPTSLLARPRTATTNASSNATTAAGGIITVPALAAPHSDTTAVLLLCGVWVSILLFVAASISRFSSHDVLRGHMLLWHTELFCDHEVFSSKQRLLVTLVDIVVTLWLHIAVVAVLTALNISNGFPTSSCSFGFPGSGVRWAQLPSSWYDIKHEAPAVVDAVNLFVVQLLKPFVKRFNGQRRVLRAYEAAGHMEQGKVTSNRDRRSAADWVCVFYLLAGVMYVVLVLLEVLVIPDWDGIMCASFTDSQNSFTTTNFCHNSECPSRGVHLQCFDATYATSAWAAPVWAVLVNWFFTQLLEGALRIWLRLDRQLIDHGAVLRVRSKHHEHVVGQYVSWGEYGPYFVSKRTWRKLLTPWSPPSGVTWLYLQQNKPRVTFRVEVANHSEKDLAHLQLRYTTTTHNYNIILYNIIIP
jgi:hypothetical protein